MTPFDRGAGTARARLARLLAPWLAPLLLRLALAIPFLQSGLLKWQGFLQPSDTARYLFASEFMLHLPGGPFPYPAPALAAFLAGCVEVILPILLVAGAGTRIAALGLAATTVVIQLTIPDGWAVHLTWFAMALAIAARGPGRVSIDRYLAARGILQTLATPPTGAAPGPGRPPSPPGRQ